MAAPVSAAFARILASHSANTSAAALLPAIRSPVYHVENNLEFCPRNQLRSRSLLHQHQGTHTVLHHTRENSVLCPACLETSLGQILAYVCTCIHQPCLCGTAWLLA